MINSAQCMNLFPPPCRGITSDLAALPLSRLASSFIRAVVGVGTVVRINSTPILTFPLQGGRKDTRGTE